MNEPSPHEQALGDLVEEFLELRRLGSAPSIDDFCDLHGALADELRPILAALIAVESAKDQWQSDHDSKVDQSSRKNAPILSSDQTPFALGEYRVIREIGHGGMGTVFEAEQISLGRRVALKVIRKTGASPSRSVERFRREARAIANLHHSNIVPVFDDGETEDFAYFAMQIIRGSSLDQLVQALCDGPRIVSENALERAVLSAVMSGRVASATPPAMNAEASDADDAAASQNLSDQDAHGGEIYGDEPMDSKSAVQDKRFFESVARIGRDAARALSYAHERGVVHRDVKPSNLLLDTSGIVWLTDFGLAKTENDDLTQPGDVVGTLRYLAPERLRGMCDARADVYGLGLTLSEFATRSRAFEGSDRASMISKISRGEYSTPGDMNALPRDLRTILQCATESDVKLRYQSAQALAEDLDRFLEGDPVSVRVPSPPEQLWRWTRRNSMLATTIGVIAVAAVLGVIMAMHFRAQRDIQKDLIRDLVERESTLRRRNYQSSMRDFVHNGTRPGLESRIVAEVEEWRPKDAERDERAWEWFYVRSLYPRALVTWKVERNDVHALNVNPDAVHVAVATGRKVFVREIESGKLIRTHASPSKVLDVAWSPNGRELAITEASGLRFVSILEPEAPEVNVPRTPGVWVSWSPQSDRVALSGEDQLSIRDSRTGALLQDIEFAESGPVDWHPSKNLLAVGHHDGSITFVDLDDESRQTKLEIEDIMDLRTFDLEWSPNGESLAISSTNGKTVIVDSDSQTMRSILETEVLQARRVRWSSDGSQLLSVFPFIDTGGIDVWNPTDGKRIVRLPAPAKEAAWLEDGRRIISASKTHLRLWNSEASGGSRRIPGSHPNTYACAWSQDGQHIAASLPGNSLGIWNVSSGARVLVMTSPFSRSESREFRTRFSTLSLSVNGTLASAATDGHFFVWDLEKDQSASIESDSRIIASQWSPVAPRLATIDAKGKLTQWDENLTPLYQQNTDAEHRGLQWSPDGKLLAACSSNGDISIWNAENGVLRGQLNRTSKRTAVFAWSPDSSQIVANTGWISGARVWDVTSLTAVRDLDVTRASAMSWSPDGRRLAVVNRLTVELWDMEHDEMVVPLALKSVVHTAKWSPDGTRLACATARHGLIVFDASDAYAREQLTELPAQ